MKQLKIIAYDISKTKTRTKVADRLLSMGMYRVQKSVFIGSIRKKSLGQFLDKFTKYFREGDKLYVIPLPESSLTEMQSFGWGEDTELLTGKKNTMVH